MKRFFFLSLSISLASGLIEPSLTLQARENNAVWTIGERTLPVPSAASDIQQQAILKSSAPNQLSPRYQAPPNEESWPKLIASANTRKARSTKLLAKKHSVSVLERTIAGVLVRQVTPPDIAPQNKDRLFIHVHGGAYIVFGGYASVEEAILIASRAKISVLSIDYRMPPKHPFPAAVDDVISVYKQLLKKHSPKSMALGGTSAGGGLALASTHKIIGLGLPVPGALFAGTPWADLTNTGDSRFTNEGIDRILVTYPGKLESCAKLYAGKHLLTNPLISPVYGDFKGFPPTYLVSGTRDLFLSDTVRTHQKMKAAGVTADLNVHEGQSHAEYLILADSPESKHSYKQLGKFLKKHLQN